MGTDYLHDAEVSQTSSQLKPRSLMEKVVKMKDSQHRRAEEHDSGSLAKRLRMDPPQTELPASSAPSTNIAAFNIGTEEEPYEDGFFDWAVFDDNDVIVSDDEDNITEDDGDLLHTQHAFCDAADDLNADSPEEAGDLVCYGMLEDVQCQVLRGRPPLDGCCLDGYDGDYFKLALYNTESQITVGVAGDLAFAQLNSVATTSLHQVAKLPRVVFHAYMARESFKDLLQKQKIGKSTISARFRLNINISGPRVDSEFVGGTLSDREMFLQEPLQRNEQDLYENPHVWTFKDLPDIDVWLAGLARGKPVGEQMAAQQGWSRVFDELPDFNTGHTDLDLSRLRTQLLKHQTDALGFMTDRESGRLDDALRYWRSGIDENGSVVFRHAVTAAERRERPSEPASGILADDVGLGKTLSSIALICTSKNRAEASLMHRRTEQLSHGVVTPVKATLVVVPSLLILDEWKKEIEKHTVPGTLRVAKYHGHDRVKTCSELSSYDIVLTTYGTITTEHRRSGPGGREVLYFLRWFRIILDEAHTIRSARTAQCKAILALYASHHWCLTGTPISNKVEDLASLLRFCRVPLLQEPASFRDHVAKITRKSFRQGCNVLRQVLSPVCLRRTKALLDLPQPRSVFYAVDFSAAETGAHRALFRHIRLRLDAAVSGRGDAKSNQTMLHAILQLRILCNQGTFMPQIQHVSDEQYLDPDEALTLLQEEGQAKCAACSVEVAIINQERDLSSGVLGTCSHILCALCRGAALDDPDLVEDYKCPKCEEPFVEKRLPNDDEPRSVAEPVVPCSTKLEKLVQDLKSSLGKEKSIVFSVWRKTLDVASRLCNDAGIDHVRIDGAVPQALRQQALEEFTTNPKISTLLMTLGTGALGLNLTAATRVHILEPQWNPAVEKQAIGRVVRIGQEKNATVIRYTVRNSVEQQIQTYQRRKMQLAAGGFSDGANHPEYESKILTATFFTEAKL